MLCPDLIAFILSGTYIKILPSYIAQPFPSLLCICVYASQVKINAWGKLQHVLSQSLVSATPISIPVGTTFQQASSYSSLFLLI